MPASAKHDGPSLRSTAGHTLRVIVLGTLGSLVTPLGCAKPVTKPKPGSSAGPLPAATPAPAARSDFVPATTSGGSVVAIGTDIFWIGGTDGRPIPDVRRFDTATRQWYEGPPITQSRLFLGAAAFGDRIIVVGGMEDVGRQSDVIEILDPDHTHWQPIGQLSTRVAGPAVAVVGDTAYAFGGEEVLDPDYLNLDTASVTLSHAIDERGNVRVIAPMPSARHRASAVAVDERIYVLGGAFSKSRGEAMASGVSYVDVYDTTTDTWTQARDMPGRGRGCAVGTGTEIVFFGAGALDSREPVIFDLQSEQWRRGKPRDREFISVVDGAAFIDGTIYVVGHTAGGMFNPGPSFVMTYEPKTDTWTRFDERHDRDRD